MSKDNIFTPRAKNRKCCGLPPRNPVAGGRRWMSGGALGRPGQGSGDRLKPGGNTVIPMRIQHQVVDQVEQQLTLLFSRCPGPSGFSGRGEGDALFVSDAGIAPRLSAEQYGEIYQDI